MCLQLSDAIGTGLGSPEEAFIAGPQKMLLWGTVSSTAWDQNADQATLTYYPPVHPNGTAIIVIPGGGYSFVAVNHEGRQIANWLNAIGVSAFVLRYRVGPKHRHPEKLYDGQRAVRLVRAGASKFGVQANRIGVMGFSAGGHLAATLMTHFDHGDSAAADPVSRATSRPDFTILAYPVITFLKPNAHRGSVTSLLGENPDPALLRETFERIARNPADIADISVQHRRRCRGRGGEHDRLLFSAAQRGRAGRTARFPTRTARTGTRPCPSLSWGLVNSIAQLASGAQPDLNIIED